MAVTIKSEFLKTGKVGDDDMMSTWSAMTDRLENEIDDEQADLSGDLSGDLSAGSTQLSSSSGMCIVCDLLEFGENLFVFLRCACETMVYATFWKV